jgi:hypothetical protein
VKNKLDNINDSTNDERAPIRQPDNVDDDSDENDQQQIAQQPQQDDNSAGLNDACLQSGFSQQQCNSYLFSKNPSGVCTTVSIVGIDCPEIQDPAKTYGDP